MSVSRQDTLIKNVFNALQNLILLLTLSAGQFATLQSLTVLFSTMSLGHKLDLIDNDYISAVTPTFVSIC